MIRDALQDAARQLEPVTDIARREAEWIMAHALGVSRNALLLHHTGDPVPGAFAPLVARRAGGEPLAYVIGQQPFYGLDLAVTPDVLIPRADSEAAIDAAREAVAEPARILDCGTGSGALLLAALSIWPKAFGIGIDASAKALEVAKANAASTGITDRARFERRDWTVGDWAADLGRFDLVLANPPYVATDDPDLDPAVARHEPASALFAGADGLADYRILIPAFVTLLSPDGVAIVEIGSRQAASVSEIARASGFTAAPIRDLGGNPRVMLLRREAGG